MAPTPGSIRPWRHLALFVVVVAGLYSLVFFTGDRNPKPKLGIDLEGGTRVTLTARTETGQPPTKEQLNLARQIIDARVNGLGVAGAEVVQDGSNLTITVPGDQGQKAKDLAQTAQLRLRPVIEALQVEPPQEAPPSGGAPASGRSGAPAPRGPGSAGPHGDAIALPGEPLPGEPAAAGSAQGQAAPPKPTPHPHAPKQPNPTPPPPAPPADAAQQGVADPELAKAIAVEKTKRQSTNPQVQGRAAQELVCGPNDVLKGYDDPKKPLVTCDQQGTEKYLLGESIIEGTEIANASANYDQRGAGYVVNLTFKAAGAQVWGDFTTKNVGKRAAFVLDTQVVSAPTINEPILGGNTQISGRFGQAESTQLAGVLKYGSLPLSFATSDAQTVSATLGLASLQAGLIAGAIGLALVFVYCLFYYRALGVLTILSLGLSGVIVYAVLVLLGRSIGFTLDLAGVAGFIISIGITADSFVIYFERLKDEVREGRSFRAAVPRAWIRARRTILSADAVSFLASAVLYLLAVGQVRGFAFTLGMSTVLDLVVVFLVTHPLVALAANSKLFSSPTWSGLGAVARIGAARRRAAAAAAKGV
ncbi:protein translocase subunit SecD [Pseudonocardia eucalypti]|uniref:Protein translocase subunit SecD n=1 Tax=Pseudonocardia eucalypti TaxID=648755 RepID=A0ABP9QRZ9_9PSEU|nr:preprotein translocase subunit SecD [Pseudonocardia eucalypti]